MNRRHLMTMTRPAAAVVLGLGAIAATACGPTAAQAPSTGSPVATVATQPVTPPAAAPAASALQAPSAPPVAVNCGAGQQALIRPLMLDGQLVSQVDCVAVPGRVAGVAAATPVAPRETVPAIASMDDDPRISAPAPRPRARTASYRTAEYEPEVYREPARKSGRSWQKSAIIIGSSAGVGAGVGAAVGGKKGALIGAAIGGGSATIWDQATRRK